MHIDIIFFGQLTDKTGCTSIRIDNPGTIHALKKVLIAKYPNLGPAKFMVAINNKQSLDNEVITDNAEVAVMPPFSGG